MKPYKHNQATTLFLNNFEISYLQLQANTAGHRFFASRNCQLQRNENNWERRPPWLKSKLTTRTPPPKSNRAKAVPFFVVFHVFQLYLLPTSAVHLGLQGTLRASIPQRTTQHNQAKAETKQQKHLGKQ